MRSLVQMDDPDHMKYRMLTAAWFTRQRLQSMKATVDALADQYVSRLAEFGGRCDFVKDLAVWYPQRVVMSILGVPEEDEPIMLKLTQELFGSTDPDVQRSFDLMSIGQVVEDFEAYFKGISEDRRKNPRDDVASIIANAEIDGAPINDLEAAGYTSSSPRRTTPQAITAGGLWPCSKTPEFDKLARPRSPPLGA